MSSFFSNISENVICIEFKYKEKNIENTIFIDIIDESKELLIKSGYKNGKIFLRKPTWSIMNDIARVSGIFDPFKKEYDIDPYKYRDFKLKRLVISIEDAEGNETKVDDKVIDSLVPQLANYILSKIDSILEIDYRDRALTRDEAREMSLEIYKYLKKKQIRDSGKFAIVPPPPSALIIYQLCEKYNILPEEARKINMRDLEIMNIVAEQTDVINNPLKYGNGPKDAHIKFRDFR